ncbi:transposase [Simplicispira psychrophila]|uniref:transposase n=1 Tax=Simplicispira psychrophila TaxID=80882 RepID=UPI0004850475|nr:transposase [Simplicispira psychrophila]
MTRPRSALVSLPDTAWYHCVSRCVRRAFLCGHDHHSGQNFEHRRGWIATRIKELAHIFAIDVAAYAVMSNHYHVVLHIDSARAQQWSTEQVLQRWTQLFTGPLLVQRYLSGARAAMGQSELEKVHEMAETYRTRLFDLSWYMRVLNESLARQANAEDDCTGRFWEGRFKSQALLDEQALLAAMAYVDLNPVRAGMAESPEASDYTSIQERLGCAPEPLAQPLAPDLQAPVDAAAESPTATAPLPQAPLMPFDATGRTPWAVPFGWHDYAELVDWTGRQVHPNKKGCMAQGSPALLARLGVEADVFIAMASTFLQEFGSAVGTPAQMAQLCARRQTRFLHGMRAARKVFG